MYHKTDIFFIDSHAECGCSHNDVYLIVHESVLVGYFFISFHFAIERECLITVASQFGRQLFGSFGA